MTTPINDPSGTGFFGKQYWGRKVFWLNVPAQWRKLDSYNYLQMLLNTWGDLGEDLISYIESLPLQRDPYLVRTRETLTRWFYVTEAFAYEDDDKGKVVRLIGEKDFTEMPGTDPEVPPSADEDVLAEWFPWFPYAPLEKVARYWQLFWRDAQYEVINVRARNYDPPTDDAGNPMYDATTSLANEVWVKGGDLTLLFDYFNGRDFLKSLDEDPLKGTPVVGTTDGSLKPVIQLPVKPVRLVPNVNPADGHSGYSRVILKIPREGGGYKLLFDKPDDLGGGVWSQDTGTMRDVDMMGYLSTVHGTINYLSGEISLDLSPSIFSSRAREEIKAKYIVRGYYLKFNAPPTIDYLAQDFGFNNDHNDPEDVQRSTLANITKFWGLKAAWKSYSIRGSISLFDVNMEGLYRICEGPLEGLVPADSIMEIDGVLYTDVRPVFIKFDHIRADEEFYDFDAGMSPAWVTLMDNMLVAQDSGRWDGMTIGQAFALDVTQGFYADISSDPGYVGTPRGPATIPAGGVQQLNESELDALGWQNGYRYTIRMKRCQWEAFNFPTDAEGNQKPELFAVSVYEHGVAPPVLGDTYYYIDRQETTWTILPPPGATTPEDVGDWVVLIQVGAGVASPLAEGDDIAVRYLPLFDSMSCCYCRSNRMRAIIEAHGEAYEFYDVPAKLDLAIERLKTKLRELVPLHARIIEYEIVRLLTDYMYGVQYGAVVEHQLVGGEFVFNVEVLLTVEYRGDSNSGTPNTDLDFRVESQITGVVWEVLNWNPVTPAGDNETWVTVVDEVSVTLPSYEILPGVSPWVRVRAIAGSASTYGDVRWTFKVKTRE